MVRRAAAPRSCTPANVDALQSATGDTSTVEFTVAGHNTDSCSGLQGSRNLADEAGAVVNWDLIGDTTSSAGVNYDQIIVSTVNLTYSGSTTLALSFDRQGRTVDRSDPFWDVNHSWVVYDLSGGTTRLRELVQP